jgi:transcription initiation factor TFIIIB Brf1 subunit/transcription initiation factor TFIIB
MENCPICISTNIREDFDFPETMLCCDDCGADFTIDNEVLFDPTELK